jgi:hypothetical protein
VTALDSNFFTSITFADVSKAFDRVWERPFNLKGWLCFFSKKNIRIPNVAEKNILILVEEKQNNLIQSFYI